jgi:stress response protein SCP2
MSAAERVSLLRGADDPTQQEDPVELVKGANTEVETGVLLCDLQWSNTAGGDLDVAAVLVDRNGRALDALAPVDRRRTASPDGSVTHVGHDRTERGWRDRLQIDLTAAPETLGRVLVTASLSGGVAGAPPVTFADVVGLEVVVGTARAGSRPVHFVVPPLGEERALLAVEIYRRGGRWRVRAVAQGYADGRAGLARDFGAVPAG